MTSKERREQILRHIREHKIGKVDDFVQQFHVSAVTIRHDLRLLEKDGCVFRCYGGATLNANFAFDEPIYRKGQINRNLKEIIAQSAADLVDDGDAIILDSGSTIMLMVPYLENKRNLVVMTNALNTAYHLSGYNNIDLHVIGGHLRQQSCSLVGQHGIEQLCSYQFQKLFLGVDGVDLEAGITTANPEEAAMNRAMCKVSHQIIAVTDSTKFGRKSFCTISAIEDIDILITDSNIPDDIYKSLLSKGITIIIADEIKN